MVEHAITKGVTTIRLRIILTQTGQQQQINVSFGGIIKKNIE
jgi:hypothetical protein